MSKTVLKTSLCSQGRKTGTSIQPSYFTCFVMMPISPLTIRGFSVISLATDSYALDRWLRQSHPWMPLMTQLSWKGCCACLSCESKPRMAMRFTKQVRPVAEEQCGIHEGKKTLPTFSLAPLAFIILAANLRPVAFSSHLCTWPNRPLWKKEKKNHPVVLVLVLNVNQVIHNRNDPLPNELHFSCSITAILLCTLNLLLLI